LGANSKALYAMGNTAKEAKDAAVKGLQL